MKMNTVFKIFVLLAIIGSFWLSASAHAQSEKLDQTLEQEFEWLKAEAAATTVSIATKTEMTLNEAPSIVSVITAEEIRNSGAKSLEEVLRQVVGFYIFENTNYPDVNASIRGLGETPNPNVKIMINGHSVGNVTEQNVGWLINISVEMIKKIEIIRGPGSALYGNGAMNGVINILTGDGKDPSSVSAAYGSFGMYRGTANFSYAKDDFSFYLFADAFGGDGDPQLIEKDAASDSDMFPPGSSQTPGYSNEEFECNTVFTRLSYKNFYLTGFYNWSERENPVGITNILTDENEVPDRNAFAEIGYDGSLTDRIRFSAKAYYDYGELDVTYEAFGEKIAGLMGFPEGESIVAKPSVKIGKYGYEVMADVSVSDSIEFVAGGLHEYMENYDMKSIVNSNIIGKPMILDGVEYAPLQYLGGMRDISNDYGWVDEEDRTVWAIYGQGTWDMIKTFPSLKQIGKTLTFTAGLRYDNYDDIGDTLNPRTGIVYAPNNKLFFKFLYGEAFRAPGFNQMYYKNNPAQEGNPDLEPETVRTAEILAGINLTEHITATLDFFHIKKENNILLYQGKYSNRGEIRSQGAEGEIRVSYDKNRYGYFNVTFQNAEDVSHEKITDIGGTEYVQEDFNLGMYPEVIANMGINYGINKHINANVSVNYIGSIARIGKMQFAQDGTLEKSDKREPLDSYTLVNLSLRFGNFDFAPGLEFQLTGYNIFDTDHRDPELDGSIENDIPRWDRHFMGKVTYTF